MSLSERLKALRKTLRLTQEAMAKALGITFQTYNRYEKGHRIPDGEVLEKIAQTFGVNLNWLLTGEGPMFVKKPHWLEEREEQEALAKELGAMLVEPVPVLGYVPAGFPTEIPEDAIVEWITLPDIPKNSFIFIAKGDSMSPIIRDGDYIVVVPNQEIVSGNIVMFQNDWGEVSVKRLRRKDGKLYLVPENPEYPVTEYDPQKHKILGRIIKAFRPIKLE